MTALTVTIWDINPEPWRTPGIVNRRAVKDGKLVAYQESIRDHLTGKYEPEEGVWHVQFFFWRSSQHGQPADATNLQKATEDACQEILFTNDKENLHVESILCEQTPTTRPCIIIWIDDFDPAVIPDRGPEPAAPAMFEGSEWTPPKEDAF